MNKYLLVHFQLDFLNLYNEDSKTLVFAIDISIIFGSLFIYCQTKYIKLRTNFSSKFVSLELRKTLIFLSEMRTNKKSCKNLFRT